MIARLLFYLQSAERIPIVWAMQSTPQPAPQFALWDVILDDADPEEGPLLVIGIDPDDETHVLITPDGRRFVLNLPALPDAAYRDALPHEVPACWRHAAPATGPSAKDVRACLASVTALYAANVLTLNVPRGVVDPGAAALAFLAKSAREMAQAIAAPDDARADLAEDAAERNLRKAERIAAVREALGLPRLFGWVGDAANEEVAAIVAMRADLATLCGWAAFSIDEWGPTSANDEIRAIVAKWGSK